MTDAIKNQFDAIREQMAQARQSLDAKYQETVKVAIQCGRKKQHNMIGGLV